jgi:hypothetical protein
MEEAKEGSNVYSQKLIDCGGGGVHGDYCDGISELLCVRKLVVGMLEE